MTTGSSSILPLQPSQDKEHITEELYKKNFELAQKNKILSLIREIDYVILSTITDPQQVAQKIANTIVRNSPLIRLVSVFLYSKADNGFHHLATSESPNAQVTFETEFQRILGRMGETSNLITKAFEKKKMCVTNNIVEIFTPFFTQEQVSKIQQDFSIKSFLIYPISIREEMYGSIVIGIEEDQNSLSYYQIDLIDRLPGIVGIAIDNCTLYKELEDANDKLKQLDKLKDEFFSLASHELRTPLTAIRGNAALLLSHYGAKFTDPAFAEMVNDMHEGSTRLIQIVNDFLDMSRLEQGKIDFKKQNFQLSDVVIQVMNELKTIGDGKGIELMTNIPIATLRVFADPDRVKQVIYNLVGNAIKFTQKGSVTVGIQQEDKSTVRVFVTDTGSGIPVDKQSLLFQKFQQAGNILTPEVSQGSGLGLYICKLLIQGMGGIIGLEKSEVGRGSTFSFTLPLAT